MANYFQNIHHEDAQQLHDLSRLTYELRDNWRSLLDRYGVDSESALLAKIENGEIEEHPAYETYLSARILDSTRETIRNDMKEFMSIARTVA